MMHTTLLFSGIALWLLVIPSISAQNCTFEFTKPKADWKELCDWTNQNTYSKWVIGNGYEFYTAPMLDHTNENTQSNFAYVPYNELSGETITMEVKAILPGTYCFQLYYVLNGDSANPMSLTATVDEKVIFSKSENLGKEWNEMSVTIKSSLEFKIMLTGSKPAKPSSHKFVGVDDISLREGTCEEIKSAESVTNNYKCNFESEIHPKCGFINVVNMSPWKMNELLTKVGPVERDHTPKALFGYGYYTFSDADSGSKSQMVSKQFNGGGFKDNLTFFYYMNGTGNTVLNVYQVKNLQSLEDDMKKEPVLSLIRKETEGWEEAVLVLPATESYRVVFEGYQSTIMSKGYIAIDDIRILSVPKTNDYKCSFESDDDPKCGLTDVDKTNAWQMNTPDSVGPVQKDHTPESDPGHYMFSNADCEKRPQLISGKFDGEEVRDCLTFYYNIKGSDNAVLNVYQVETVESLKDGVKPAPVLRRITGETGGWKEAVVDLSAGASFRVVFEGYQATKSSTGYVAIDDIRIQSGSCSETDTKCTFDNNMCYWNSFGKSKSIQNFKMIPYTYGTFDHTLGSPSGNFLQPANGSKGALLQSNTFAAASSDLDNCFTFWYTAIGSEPGSLEVVLHSNYKKIQSGTFKKMWRMEGVQDGGWKSAFVNIEKNLIKAPFQIQIVATAKPRGVSNGSYFIDDTELLRHGCANEPEEAALQKDCKIGATGCKYFGDNHSIQNKKQKGIRACTCEPDAFVSPKEKTTVAPPSSTEKTTVTPPVFTEKTTVTPPVSTEKTTATPPVSTEKTTVTPPSSTEKTTGTSPSSTEKTTVTPPSSVDSSEDEDEE